jgi:hypothetical protein
MDGECPSGPYVPSEVGPGCRLSSAVDAWPRRSKRWSEPVEPARSDRGAQGTSSRQAVMSAAWTASSAHRRRAGSDTRSPCTGHRPCGQGRRSPRRPVLHDERSLHPSLPVRRSVADRPVTLSVPGSLTVQSMAAEPSSLARRPVADPVGPAGAHCPKSPSARWHQRPKRMPKGGSRPGRCAAGPAPRRRTPGGTGGRVLG